MGGEESAESSRTPIRAFSNKNQGVISKRAEPMSRNNVFKLSGNMALGGGDGYPSNDFDNIKNSLKLLKSKQPQKKTDPPLEPTNAYGGSYSSSSQQRQPQASKNPPSKDYNGYGYQQGQPSKGQSNSYKDVYYEMEQQQHYPSKQSNVPSKQNQYPPKSNDYPSRQRQAPQYEQYEQYQKPKGFAKNKAPPKQQHRQDYRAPKGENVYQQKTIKEVNRENRVEIKEYDPSELVECGEGCGRKFNPDSIDKHEAICKKVFQKKRKEFNAQDQRIVAREQPKLMKKGEMVEKKIEEKKAKEKIPKWKADSLQLRAGLKQARDEDYVPSKQDQKILDQQKQNSMVKCQFCGRSFNEKAAERHIPFCESQQKKNVMKKR